MKACDLCGKVEATMKVSQLDKDGKAFRPDGGEHRRFQTLWFRTYRYVQAEIETADQPLRRSQPSTPLYQRSPTARSRPFVELATSLIFDPPKVTAKSAT